MAPPKKEPRYCPVCNGILAYYQKYFCSKSCYGIASRSDGFTDRARKKDIKFKPKTSDKKQMRINLEIDRRDTMKLESRILRPGDKGFDEVARTITPIHLIKKTARTIGYLQEIDGGYV